MMSESAFTAFKPRFQLRLPGLLPPTSSGINTFCVNLVQITHPICNAQVQLDLILLNSIVEYNIFLNIR